MADRIVPDPRLAVDLGAGLRLQNPVMPASGCFGVEMASLVDLNALGALVPKTIFYGARAGNPSPRLAETPAGMLNSVGIPSRGIDGPVIAKLTPNVTRINDIALAAEAAGATAISAINTFVAMAIDVRARRPLTGTPTAGISGPAIKPMALRMVWETARTVRVPVIGMGGIGSAQDALEFILAGASAVAIGTANFTRPTAMHDTIAGLSRFLDDEGVSDVRELIGALRYEAFGAAGPPHP